MAQIRLTGDELQKAAEEYALKYLINPATVKVVNVSIIAYDPDGECIDSDTIDAVLDIEPIKEAESNG